MAKPCVVWPLYASLTSSPYHTTPCLSRACHTGIIAVAMLPPLCLCACSFPAINMGEALISFRFLFKGHLIDLFHLFQLQGRTLHEGFVLFTTVFPVLEQYLNLAGTYIYLLLNVCCINLPHTLSENIFSVFDVNGKCQFANKVLA